LGLFSTISTNVPNSLWHLSIWGASRTFFLDEKSTKKIKAVCKSYNFAKISGGAKPNSPFLRQGSNRVLLHPPSISQNRDLQKADTGWGLATCFSAFFQQKTSAAKYGNMLGQLSGSSAYSWLLRDVFGPCLAQCPGFVRVCHSRRNPSALRARKASPVVALSSRQST
jgi:hypothetical protein